MCFQCVANPFFLNVLIERVVRKHLSGSLHDEERSMKLPLSSISLRYRNRLGKVPLLSLSAAEIVCTDFEFVG